MAFDLLEKRSSVHSSRPKQVFAGEMHVISACHNNMEIETDKSTRITGSAGKIP